MKPMNDQPVYEPCSTVGCTGGTTPNNPEARPPIGATGFDPNFEAGYRWPASKVTFKEFQEAKDKVYTYMNQMCDVFDNLISTGEGLTEAVRGQDARIEAINKELFGMHVWANNVTGGMEGTRLRIDAFYDWVSAGMKRTTALEDCVREQGNAIKKLEAQAVRSSMHIKALESKTEGTSTKFFGSLTMKDRVVTRDEEPRQFAVGYPLTDAQAERERNIAKRPIRCTCDPESFGCTCGYVIA